MKEYGWQTLAEVVDRLLKARLGTRFQPDCHPGMGGPSAIGWGFDFPPSQKACPHELIEKIVPEFDHYVIVNYGAVVGSRCRRTGYFELLFSEVVTI